MPGPVNSIKELLHKAIDESENEKLLEAVYTILSSQKWDSDFSFDVSEDQLNMLKEREEKYLAGSNERYSLENFKRKFSDEHGL